eukprot:m.95312 g.95312  ORF g.95312 m.95312 type:complete len:258 (+) comp8743_c0_seq1:25-798(+)
MASNRLNLFFGRGLLAATLRWSLLDFCFLLDPRFVYSSRVCWYRFCSCRKQRLERWKFGREKQAMCPGKSRCLSNWRLGESSPQFPAAPRARAIVPAAVGAMCAKEKGIDGGKDVWRQSLDAAGHNFVVSPCNLPDMRVYWDGSGLVEREERDAMSDFAADAVELHQSIDSLCKRLCQRYPQQQAVSTRLQTCLQIYSALESTPLGTPGRYLFPQSQQPVATAPLNHLPRCLGNKLGTVPKACSAEVFLVASCQCLD